MCVRARVCVCVCVFPRARVCECVRVCARVCVRARVCAHALVCESARAHVCERAYVFVCARAMGAFSWRRVSVKCAVAARAGALCDCTAGMLWSSQSRAPDSHHSHMRGALDAVRQ